MQPLTEEEKKSVRSLSDADFRVANPFMKRSCNTCTFCKGYINLWCTNGEASKYRGTSIPGVIFCTFWEPDWSEIPKQYKTEENGYTKPTVKLKRSMVTKLRKLFYSIFKVHRILETKFVSYEEGNRMVMETANGPEESRWVLAPEEDTNSFYGMVFLCRKIRVRE